MDYGCLGTDFSIFNLFASVSNGFSVCLTTCANVH